MKKRFIQSCRLDVNKIYKGLLTALICLISLSSLHATNYYVDNINGNNSNNGTSTGTAWFDFTNVNSRTFAAGDQILLKAGCVWNSELHLKGSGTSANFIVLDSYGSGSKPKIQRNSQAADRTVYLDNNPSYFKVKNLEICNAGDGIRLNYTTKGNSSVYFENLYIHNIDYIVNGSPATDGAYYSTGITVSNGTSAKPTSVNDYVATDIRITNCEIAFTTAPFTFLHVFTNPSGANTESPWSFKNILIDNNNIHDHKGPISFRDLNNSYFTNNVCKNGGYVALPQGTTGIFCFNIDNTFFEGNVLDGIPNTGSADQTWIDNEAYCNNTQVYGNLIKNTAGAGMEFLGLGSGAQPPRGSDDYNTNNIIDGNTFYNNGSGALKLLNNSGVTMSGTVTNNIYQSGNTFFNGSTAGFTLTNNNASAQSSTNLALYKSYIASSNWDNTQRASKAFDGSASSNWQSASGSFANQWLRINFGASTTFDKVTLSEFGNRTSGFRIEYSNDGITWQTAYTGTAIGNSNTINFTAVTGKMARIYFTGGTSTPIIYEFEIYTAAQQGGNNLASNKTYSSSSNWDGTQTADKGFDGNYSTNWQSANSGFANQWLQVNFGDATVFNKVVLSEYGDRTSGFRIEYSTNGTTWQTAYTGTTIGNSKTITFTAVTGNYARIYFTSGANTPIIYEFEVYNTGGSNGVNFIQNPSFDVDNFDTQTPTSWSTWTSLNTSDADYTGSADPHTGARSLAHWRNGAYNVFTYQTITGLTNGTYTATVYAKTIGTPSTCLLKAQDFGGAAVTTDISSSNYIKYTLGNIQVTNGQCLIGIYTAGDQNSAALFDDVTLSNNNNPFVNRVIRQPVNENNTALVKNKLLYPNPSRGEASIVYELPANSMASLLIYDISGKLVRQSNFVSANATTGKLDINTADLNNGTYIVTIKAGSRSITQKLIIEK